MSLALYNFGYPPAPQTGWVDSVLMKSAPTASEFTKPKVNPAHHPATHSGNEDARRKRAKLLLEAAGLMGVGLLLHRLPARVPEDGFKTLLPADWKVWARVLLGMGAVQKINQAFDLKLPPWLSALEAVAVINPVAVGFSKVGLKQTAVMAPVVAGVVQAASLLHQKIAKPMQEQCQVSPILSQIGVTIGLGLAAMLAYPRLYKLIASMGIIGKELKEEAAAKASAFASATFTTCARGCSPGSFICLSELADIVASFGSWFSSNRKPEKPGPTAQAPAANSHCGPIDSRGWRV